MTIKNTRWQMIRSEKIIDVDPPAPKVHGDPSYYKYAVLPFPDDLRWEDAPTKAGKLHFEQPSRLPAGSCFKKLDFTYFRTYVEIPEGTDIQKFRVTIAQVDDGARMYLFNDSNVGGTYQETEDAKLNGRGVSVDFKDKAVHGWNMVMIVQFDDCPVENKLTGGVEIVLNDKVVTTDPKLEIPDISFAPKKFKMETYGVSGKGRTGPSYWIGWNAKHKKPGIVTDDEVKNSASYIFEIEKVEMEKGVALKVMNYHEDPDASYYLPDPKQKDPVVYQVRPPKEHQRNLVTDDEYNFISFELASEPGVFLRHSGFVLYNQRGNDESAVYRQDCTWRFHEIK